MEVGAKDEDCWVDVPAEETDRTGLEEAEGEEYWVAWWLEGVRGGPLLPGSAGEVISHFGGMTDCLGGRGSRRVSRRDSGSGMKWLSDSVKTWHHKGYEIKVHSTKETAAQFDGEICAKNDRDPFKSVSSCGTNTIFYLSDVKKGTYLFHY